MPSAQLIKAMESTPIIAGRGEQQVCGGGWATTASVPCRHQCDENQQEPHNHMSPFDDRPLGPSYPN